MFMLLHFPIIKFNLLFILNQQIICNAKITLLKKLNDIFLVIISYNLINEYKILQQHFV